MIRFTTINDVSPHLGGFLEMFTVEQYWQLCAYVWEHGRYSPNGVCVYRDAAEREDDISDLAAEDVKTVRRTPTLHELAARFIRDVLHASPSDYALQPPQETRETTC